MWEVVLLEEVDAWFLELSQSDPRLAEQIVASIDLLAATGPSLGRPVVDTLKGSKVHNLKELRAGSTRIIFVFDPSRNAVLLVAGDKRNQWKEWYEVSIPIAESRYEEWLAILPKEANDGA
jgi:hypothetical protein